MSKNPTVIVDCAGDLKLAMEIKKYLSNKDYDTKQRDTKELKLKQYCQIPWDLPNSSVPKYGTKNNTTTVANLGRSATIKFYFCERFLFRKIWIIQIKERIPPEVHITPAPNRRADGRMTKLPWIRSKAIPKAIIERVPATIFQSEVSFDSNIFSTILYSNFLLLSDLYFPVNKTLNILKRKNNHIIPIRM